MPSTGPSKLLSRLSILPPDDEEDKNMDAAEIILLPPINVGAPSLLLCTNRYSKHEQGDAIALFAIQSDGSVERAPKPFYRGVGKHIRALAGNQSGRYIAAAGRDEGGVVILERTGQNGLELSEVARLDLPLVVAPLWMP